MCQRVRPVTLLKERLWHRCFRAKFVKFVRTSFLQNNSGRLLLNLWLRCWFSEAVVYKCFSDQVLLKTSQYWIRLQAFFCRTPTVAASEFLRQQIPFCNWMMFIADNRIGFCKKGVLGKFASFTGKHLCWSLFFIELQTFSPATILKRDSNTDLFLWSLLNFYENLIWNLRVTASETCSFTWIILCNNLLFRLKLVHCFSFCIINYGFVCQFPFHYNWYSRPDLQSLTLSKITFRQRWFFCEFCEMSHKTFLMNPSDGYFCINTRPVYFPSTTLCLFKNDVTHIFRFSIFST